MGVAGAVIGYILLIPCVIGFLLGAAGLYGAKKADTGGTAVVDGNARQKLEAWHIPGPIIARVLANEWLNDDELAQLTHDQQAAVDRYKTAVSLEKSGVGLGSFLAGGVSVVLMIATFFVGLIGWVLTLRKNVLRCAQCGALAPAS
jgi:hypothetical protein